MTEDEFRIQESKAPSAREIRNEIHKAHLRELRRVSGITEEVLKSSTTGGCVVAMQMGRQCAFKAFDMVLPGVPQDEQLELLGRLEALWKEREKQVKKAMRFINEHYDIIEKEEVE